MICNALARFLATPAISSWLIQRAQRTPYFHITSADGKDVYMERYWLFNPFQQHTGGTGRRWGDWIPSVRIHCIRREDQAPHMHDHPWNARTFILQGWYDERRPLPGGFASTRRHAGDTASLKFGQYHHIERVAPGGAWTLFITWRKRGTWGFLVEGRKVPWREYLGLDNAGAAHG